MAVNFYSDISIGSNDTAEATITRLASGTSGGPLSVKGGDASGSNKLGGNLNLYGGAGRGAPAGGSIKFFSTPGGTESSGVLGTHVEIAGLDSVGNLQVDGGITTGSTSFVNSSGVIQVATQGTIDHDSLANFVAAEHYRWDTDISSTATINAANIPTLNQDTTGNADTATALTTGDKTITGHLDIKSSSASGSPLIRFNQTTTRRGFIQMADTNNNLRVASEYGSVSLEAAATEDSDSDTSYIRIQPGGTVEIGAVDGDATIATDGNMTFRIDADNDETSQKFAFQNNASTEVASLDESGNLSLDGGIELGHASDTTISRSAAGTVTIEGKTIATTNKTVAFFNSSFFNSSTSAFYAPFNYLFEQTSLSTASYFAMISAPYDGRVLKVSSRTQSSSNKTTTVEMYLNGDDSDLTNDQVGTDLVIGTYTSGGTGTCAADWVFSAGDALSFRVTNSASGSGQVLTFVIEFDLDT